MKKLRFLAFVFCLVAINAFAGPLVIFHTSLGDIEVELYQKDKPITVQNFLDYVEAGYYNNTILHRDPLSASGATDFVIQGGEYNIVTNSGQAELAAIPNFPPIQDEFATGTRYSNVYGTLAMAKVGGDTNSATSSWFFNLTNNASLDAADMNNLFCVFGHVLRGTNVLNQFIGRFYGYGLVDLGDNTPFASLPVNYIGNTAPQVSNLYFITISTLSPQAQLLTNGMVKVSWTSVNGLTNALEFATNFPPTWQTLETFVGNGSVIAATDPTTNHARFYRVQILY